MNRSTRLVCAAVTAGVLAGFVHPVEARAATCSGYTYVPSMNVTGGVNATWAGTASIGGSLVSHGLNQLWRSSIVMRFYSVVEQGASDFYLYVGVNMDDTGVSYNMPNSYLGRVWQC